jgi:hypothetical protein
MVGFMSIPKPSGKKCLIGFEQVTSQKDQEQYWVDKLQPYRYISVKAFADKFKSFHVGQKMADELAVPYPKDQSHNAALSFERYSVTSMELFKANFAKEILLMRRNSFVYIFKTVQVLIYFFHSLSLCHLLALFLSSFA